MIFLQFPCSHLHMDNVSVAFESGFRLSLLRSLRVTPSAAPRLHLGSAVYGRCFSHRAHPSASLSTSLPYPLLFSNVNASPSTFAIHGCIQSNILCKSSLMEESTIDDNDIDASGGQCPPSGNRGGGGGGWDTMGRASSVFIFAFWAAFLAYSFFFSPNQTPTLDQYFLQRLLFLKADEGYQMNSILVCLWNVMGIWPALYAMLLIPSGRSSKGGVLVWPFAILSTLAGVFALLPYFGLWQPPPPRVSKDDIDGWPLKILDSKILSLVLAVAGVSLIGFASFAGEESWKEFLQLFNSSRFIHVMSLDFLALSSLAPFWIYNDMGYRNWYDLVWPSYL